MTLEEFNKLSTLEKLKNMQSRYSEYRYMDFGQGPDPMILINKDLINIMIEFLEKLEDK